LLEGFVELRLEFSLFADDTGWLVIFRSIYPNVAYLCRAKTRKSASDVVARRLGQVEAYLTVR